MKKWINLSFLFSVLFVNSYGQNDLLDLLESNEGLSTTYTISTFKSTRLISGHSVEMNSQGVLQFLIGHRFGRVDNGFDDLFGIDNALIRLGFDYGLTDNLNIGIGRSSFERTLDGFAKWRFLRQKKGLHNFPFTATAKSSIYYTTLDFSAPDRVYPSSSRFNYATSLMLARKFSKRLSFQITPMLIHRNLVVLEADQNTIFSLGIGGSFGVSKSTRINFEYFYLLPNQIESTIGGETVKNALSIGVDLETGGHVFQLHFTNSRGLTEQILVSETTGDWSEGQFHFGFNVSRVFTVARPKKVL